MIFGLDPKQILSGPVALWWGIRAIYKPYSKPVIDILHDRQQFSNYDDATEKQRKAICAWYEKRGRKLLEKRLVDEHVDEKSDKQVTVRDGDFNIYASPCRSYGYLYMGVWRDEVCQTSNTESPPALPKVKRSGLGSRRKSSTSPRSSETATSGTPKDEG